MYTLSTINPDGSTAENSAAPDGPAHTTAAHAEAPTRSSVSLEELLATALEENAKNDGRETEILDEESNRLFRSSILKVAPNVENALKLALKYHAGQTRKGDFKEYIIHILEISELLYEGTDPALIVHPDPDIITASICHDLLEDTACPEAEIASNCGVETLRIVKAVSNDPELENPADWEKKKEKYIAGVRAGGQKAKLVALADKIVNLRSLLKAWRREGDAVWTRFHRGRDKKLWFEKKVLEMLEEEGLNQHGGTEHPLLNVYRGLIKELAELPQVKTTPPLNCHIWNKPDLTIEELNNSTEVLKTYTDESHLIRRLLKCNKCGQLYFYEFYEEIDWSGGNDPQYRTWIPVDDETSAEVLSKMSPLHILNYPSVRYDWPSDAKEPVGPTRPKLK